MDNPNQAGPHVPLAARAQRDPVAAKNTLEYVGPTAPQLRPVNSVVALALGAVTFTGQAVLGLHEGNLRGSAGIFRLIMAFLVPLIGTIFGVCAVTDRNESKALGWIALFLNVPLLIFAFGCFFLAAIG